MMMSGFNVEKDLKQPDDISLTRDDIFQHTCQLCENPNNRYATNIRPAMSAICSDDSIRVSQGSMETNTACLLKSGSAYLQVRMIQIWKIRKGIKFGEYRKCFSPDLSTDVKYLHTHLKTNVQLYTLC